MARRLATLSLGLIVALSACSGLSTTSVPLVRIAPSAGAATAARSGSLAFTVTVPARSTNSRLRKAEAVSAATRSFAFAVDGTTVATQNVGLGQTGCATDYAHPAVYQFPYTTTGEARGMALDGSGNVWFVEDNGSSVDRINSDDSIARYVNTPGRTSNDLTLAADGTFFVSYLYGLGIGHFNPATTTWLADVNNGNDQSQIMALGSDGNLYYSAFSGSAVNRIDRIDGSGGSFTQFPTTNGIADGIVRGGDGNIWATESSGVARLTPSGVVTEFPVSGAVALRGLAAGTDGNVYAADINTGTIYRISTTSGSVLASWTIPAQSGLVAPANPLRLVYGPDRAIYTTVYSDATPAGFVARLDPSAGTWTVIPISGTAGTTLFAGRRTSSGAASSMPWGLVFDPRGVLYVSERNNTPGNQIAQITFPQRCTTTVAAVPSGTHTIRVDAFDGLAGAGNKLSAGTVTTAIIADASNVVSLTLNTVGASATVQPSTHSISCGPSGSFPITINALDALGATVVGAYTDTLGNPLTFTLTNSDTSGVTSLSGTAIASSAASVTLNYSGAGRTSTATISASGGGVTATPATYSNGC